jgi:predicted nuclease of restriction endonuclease-like (RecB) superfamily
MRLSDKNAMNYYLTEAAANNWSVRTLDRNISPFTTSAFCPPQKKTLL